MKKIALIALVSILTITSVFAGGLFNSAKKGPDIAVGLTTGFEQDILNPDVDGLDNYVFNAVPVKATGLFGITDHFAMGANLGMGINLKNEDFMQNDTKVGFAADVMAYYVLPLMEKMDLYLGGGFGYDYYVVNEVKNAGKNTLHTMDIV